MSAVGDNAVFGADIIGSLGLQGHYLRTQLASHSARFQRAKHGLFVLIADMSPAFVDSVRHGLATAH